MVRLQSMRSMKMLNVDFNTETGSTIAVSGYKKGCGKTQLSSYIARQLATDKRVCLVTQSDKLEVSHYNTVVESLFKGVSFDVVNEAPTGTYDVVVYDYIPDDVEVDSIYYIVRPPLEDLSLNIVDKELMNFKQKVYGAIYDKFEIVPVFIDEDMITLKENRMRDLQETDWVVIRELEHMFLQGTDIGNARRFLREVKNKNLTSVHSF